ncbi:MAG: hypothetical protein FJX77_09645, partial [Armatimonadetes bacterium]|nr:hypothetical protein [Armatimonadota bacterium]
MDPREARLELLRLLQPGLSPFPYDRAALLLAVDEVPGLDLPHYERQLDRFAAATQGALRPGLEREPRERLGALRRVLYEDEGFHGDRTSYYDIRNS